MLCFISNLLILSLHLILDFYLVLYLDLAIFYLIAHVCLYL
jgi:hypothetical protein